MIKEPVFPVAPNTAIVDDAISGWGEPGGGVNEVLLAST
jgi:hypothetical protein